MPRSVAFKKKKNYIIGGIKVAGKKFKVVWEVPGSPGDRTWRFHCWGQVQSLFRGLRSHKPCGTAKKKKIFKVVKFL